MKRHSTLATLMTIISFNAHAMELADVSHPNVRMNSTERQSLLATISEKNKSRESLGMVAGVITGIAVSNYILRALPEKLRKVLGTAVCLAFPIAGAFLGTALVKKFFFKIIPAPKGTFTAAGTVANAEGTNVATLQIDL